jgi:mannosyltransferase OCH1-like enzyme
MPDYTFKCWNESNFPIEKYRFAQEALAKKKWAFLSDVARLHALYYEGGIYLDTDIELLKPLDVFLKEDAFTSYESLNLMATGVMGFKKHHPWLALMLSWYDGVHCDDDYTEIANTKVASKITRLHYGIKLDGREQTLPDGLHIYPRDYFSPEILDHKWQVTENTYCIHHFTGLW